MCVSGVSEENRLLTRCAIHLRKFNDALLINDSVRMVDALRLLEEFYTTETRIVLDVTDEFLTGLFNGTDCKTLKTGHVLIGYNYGVVRFYFHSRCCRGCW